MRKDSLVLTLREAAALMNVDAKTLRRQATATGEVLPGVPAVRLTPKRWGVYRAALLRALERHGTEQASGPEA